MSEFLLGFVTWPQVMWLLGSAMVAMFVLVAWLDKKDWKGWAAFLHFSVIMVAGLNWIWCDADGLIYQIFSRQAFWVNAVALAVYVILFWRQEGKDDCLIATDRD